VRRLTAVEIDRDLAAALRRDSASNVAVVEGDFLHIDLAVLPRANPIRVAGNLPYNVASPILFRLVDWFSSGAPVVDATVMLQREVADRLIAVPGTRDYGVLSVLIGHAARVERLLTLPPGAFRPPPKVHSALVRLRFHAPEPPVADREAFVRLVQAVFTRRRKTLANALLAYRDDGAMAAAALRRSGIDGRRRPETLAIAEFARLADVYMSETAGSDPGPTPL